MYTNSHLCGTLTQQVPSQTLYLIKKASAALETRNWPLLELFEKVHVLHAVCPGKVCFVCYILSLRSCFLSFLQLDWVATPHSVTF